MVASAALPDVIAGPFRNPANNHIYYLLSGAAWSESEARAVELGGHLVSINNAAENDWIVETFGGSGGGSRHLWIGLTDRADEDNFRWTSGEPFTFSNWNSGEPNNSGGTPAKAATKRISFTLSPEARAVYGTMCQTTATACSRPFTVSLRSRP